MNTRNIFLLGALAALGVLLGMSLAPQPAGAAPEVWTPKWHHVVVDDSGDVGYHSSIAYQLYNGDDDGWPWVSYYVDGVGLKVARYVNGAAVSCSNGWDCAVLDKNGSVTLGYENSMVIDQFTAAKWIAYTDPNIAQLRLAKLDVSNSKSIWTHLDLQGPLDNPVGSDAVKYPSIVLIDHKPVVAAYYFDKSYQVTELNIISGTTPASFGVIADVDSPNLPSLFGAFPSVDYDQINDMTQVAYRGAGSPNNPSSHTLNYAFPVPPGTGGDGCRDDNPYGLVTDWDCRVIDPTPETGNYISFHAGGGLLDWPQVAYYNATKHTLMYARNTGGQTSCGTGAVVGWECQEIETIGTGGGVAMVVQSYPGTPTIAYYDNDDYANGVLKVARLVGSGGNCGLGSAAGQWQCVVADRGLVPFVGTHDVGLNPSIILSGDGRVYISYYDATAKTLRVANEQGDAPAFSKTYGKSTVSVGEAVQATYTITNKTGATMTGIAFTDYTTPTALVPGIAPVQNSCFGSIGYLNSQAGFYLTGGVLGAGRTCTVVVPMVANTVGTHVDTTAPLYSTEAQINFGATAMLTIKSGYKLFLPLLRR